MLKHALHNSEQRYADYTIFLGIICAQASVKLEQCERLSHSWVLAVFPFRRAQCERAAFSSTNTNRHENGAV